MNTEPNRTYTSTSADRPPLATNPTAQEAHVYDRPAQRGWPTGVAIAAGIVLLLAIAVLLALFF